MMNKQEIGHKYVSLIWKVVFFLFLFQSIVLLCYAYLAKQELDERLIQEKVDFKKMSEVYLNNAMHAHVQNIEDEIYKLVTVKASSEQVIVEFLKREWPNLSIDWGATGATLYNEDNQIQFKYGQGDWINNEQRIQSSVETGLPEHHLVCSNDCFLNIIIPLEFDNNHATLIINTNLLNPITEFQQLLNLKTVMITPKLTLHNTVGSGLDWLDSNYQMLNKDANKYYYKILKLVDDKSNLIDMLTTGVITQYENEHYFVSAFEIPFNIGSISYFVVFNDISHTLLLDKKFNRTFSLFSVVTMIIMFFVILLVLWKPISRIKKLKEYLPTLAKDKRVKIFSPGQHYNLFWDEIDVLEDSSNELAKRLSTLNNVVIDREEKLKKIALFDSVTGLANRDNFLSVLQANISNLEGNGKFIAIFFIDLDRFKHINDTLGHNIGTARSL